MSIHKAMYDTHKTLAKWDYTQPGYEDCQRFKKEVAEWVEWDRTRWKRKLRNTIRKMKYMR